MDPELYKPFFDYLNNPANATPHRLFRVLLPQEVPVILFRIDIVGPLAPTKSGKNILSLLEAHALSEATASAVATFLIEDIICQHGSPKKLLSDQENHFANKW
ncbi:34330_t:CDS:2, partial [Gigaspora margarita]